MILLKKILVFSLLGTIFLSVFNVLGQTKTDTYEKLWNVIQNDTVAKEKKRQYLEVYYQKALTEKNTLETYRALEKKSFLVPFNEGVILLQKMKPLVTQIGNDSLSGDFLNRNTVIYYKKRSFKEALDYAVQSEIFNEKINNFYNLNSVRIDIGNIYYHTRNYNKAILYFTQAQKNFKTNKGYNHQRAYVLTLYSLCKTYWQIGNKNLLAATIKEAEQAIGLLDTEDQKLETAYVNYAKGGLAYLQNNETVAQNYFEKALPIVKENEDISNEHVIYLYLGKIAWQQNQKEKAIAYFTKIDTLFKQKKFLNYELRETYNYLITYYKETNQPKQQLQATESLIALNQQFEEEQQYLTNTLHYELETKKLEASKNHLTQQLNTSKNNLFIWLVLGGLLCLALVVYGVWQNKQKKQWRLHYNNLIHEAEEAILNKPTFVETSTLINDVANNKVADVVVAKEAVKLSVTELRLLQALQLFENEKEFLKPLKLDDFASQLNTNRNTLSKLINVHKNANFNQYINRLRVKQVLIDLKYNRQLRKLSMQNLAESYGFANAKTFTAQFKTETQLTPAYYIEQLELDDLQKTKNT